MPIVCQFFWYKLSKYIFDLSEKYNVRAFISYLKWAFLRPMLDSSTINNRGNSVSIWNLCTRFHYNDVIMTQWRLKSPASRMFTQSSIQARSKKISKFRVTGLCVGNSPGTGEFPAQMASSAENVSIWWRHHVNYMFTNMNYLVPAWISNYIHYILWCEIIYPFLNLNGAAVIFRNEISNFISHCTRYMITYPCWD